MLLMLVISKPYISVEAFKLELRGQESTDIIIIIINCEDCSTQNTNSFAGPVGLGKTFN